MKHAPLTPEEEEVDAELYAPSLRFDMLRSKCVDKTRDVFVRHVVVPLENTMFNHWLADGRAAEQVEKTGIPRRSVEKYLASSLDLVIGPKWVEQHASMVHSFSSRSQGKRARNQFIWNGDWDLKTYRFEDNERYTFIADI